MINGRSILAIIHARGGSKRLPGKNIKILGDKPLIAWTIEAAKGSKYIDRIIVSTDSDEIAKVAKDWNVEVPFKRPAYLATDGASSEATIEHTLNWLKDKEGKIYDYFVLLQPTSPLRQSSHIDEAIRQLNNNKVDALIGVVKIFLKTLEKNFRNENKSHKTLGELTNEPNHFSFLVNGGLYICKTHVFLEDRGFYKRNCFPFIMDRASSLDIDNENDWSTAKEWLKRN